MKKFIIPVLAIVLVFGAAVPAFASEDTTSTSSPVFSAGGHASDAEMQSLLGPTGYQTYLAVKAGNGVQTVAPTSEEAILMQIISLLKQEIALVQAGQQ